MHYTNLLLHNGMAALKSILCALTLAIHRLMGQYTENPVIYVTTLWIRKYSLLRRLKNNEEYFIVL